MTPNPPALLTDRMVNELAASLRAREDAAQPGPPPISEHLGVTLADAYRVQLRYVALRIAGGARVVGHKVGCTNAELQRQFGIDRPDYGHLLDDMLLNDGATVRAKDLIQPRIEPEIAFILNRPLENTPVTPWDVLEVTRGVAPCLEVIDSRIQDWTITIADTIADNGSSARVILGNTLYPVDSTNLRSLGVVLERNGMVEATGAGAAVLGHPAQSVAWLANTLAERGSSLQAGHIVLSGALTRSVPIVAGDVIYADFGPLGVIRCRVD